MKNNLNSKLQKLIKALNYDTAPDPPCATFCKDYEECTADQTICLNRRGHHIFSWSDIIRQHNKCKCPSVLFDN